MGSGTRFHGNFCVNVSCFLPFSPVFSTESCSFGHGLKDLFPIHKSDDEVFLDR